MRVLEDPHWGAQPDCQARPKRFWRNASERKPNETDGPGKQMTRTENNRWSRNETEFNKARISKTNV